MATAQLSKLYEKDETAWLDRCVSLIKEGRHDDLDFSNLAEFLESMAKRDRREVRSHLINLLMHLLKWDYQAEKRTRSWELSIVNARDELQQALESKALRKHAAIVMEDAYAAAVKRAVIQTGKAVDDFPAHCPYTIDGLLEG